MKNRIMSLLAAVWMTAAFCLPSFAADYYASDESSNAAIPDYIDSITISEENVSIPHTGEKNTFELSPDGNLTLVDDYYQPAADGDTEAKQFLTVTTKSGKLSRHHVPLSQVFRQQHDADLHTEAGRHARGRLQQMAQSVLLFPWAVR